MNEIVVKKDKFKNALSNIEKNAKENKKLPELKKFDENGPLFGLIEKKITAREMNAFSSKLQDNLMKMNNKINAFYKQFTDVYVAFESLDKEYISGIVGAFNQAIEATKKAEDAQKDINNTVEILEKTVEKIKEFNNKVSQELSLIDGENWRNNAVTREKELAELDAKANDILKLIDSYNAQYEELKKEQEFYKEQYEVMNRELESFKEEKKKNSKLLRAFIVISGISLFISILLILIIVIGIVNTPN